MSINPSIAGVVSYSTHRIQNCNVGATVIQAGDIVKFDTALIVPAADDDENGAFFVALEYGKASGTIATNSGIAVVPLADCLLRMGYTGSTPAVGTSYGISDCRTLDQANTTNLLLTVLAVSSADGYVIVKDYQLSS